MAAFKESSAARTTRVLATMTRGPSSDRLPPRPNACWLTANRGSGTRILIDRLLDGKRPPGYTFEARSHTAVAAAVAQGPGRLGRRHRVGCAAGRPAIFAIDRGTLRFPDPESAGSTSPGARIPRVAGKRDRPRSSGLAFAQGRRGPCRGLSATILPPRRAWRNSGRCMEHRG